MNVTAKQRPHLSDQEAVSAAAKLAERGWFVFPVRRGGKMPAIPSTHPAGDSCRGGCGQWGHGFRDATDEPGVVREMWARWPGSNIGVACGPSQLVVVDLDVADGPRPVAVLQDQADEPTPEGVTTAGGVLRWLAQRRGGAGSDLITLTVSTPSGGSHLYFGAGDLEVTSGAGMASGLGWLLDVRARGGYVVVPPSRRPEGSYRSNGGQIRPLPDWLVEALAAAGRIPDRRPVPVGTNRPRKPDPHGPRWTAYVRAAVAGEIQRVLDSGEGGRNVELNRASFALGQLSAAHSLDEEAIADELADAARGAGLTAAEAHRTIRSGLAAGRRSPRGTTP